MHETELVAELPRRLQRGVLDDDRAEPQHGVEGDDVLRLGAIVVEHNPVDTRFFIKNSMPTDRAKYLLPSSSCKKKTIDF